MYVVKSKEAAFVHIPKTGGVAIVRNVLGPLGVKRRGGRPRHVGYRPLVPKRWFVFTFIRDPYTRMVSMYRHRTKIKGRSSESLTDFLVRTKSENDILKKPTAQVGFLAPCVEIFRYEQFDEGVRAISHRLQVTPPEIKRTRRNNSFGPYDWRTFVDEQSIETINDMFRSDFTELGYEMKTWNQIQATLNA